MLPVPILNPPVAAGGTDGVPNVPPADGAPNDGTPAGAPNAGLAGALPNEGVDAPPKLNDGFGI